MAEQLKHRLLLVDDEPEILFSLQAYLRREFEIFNAANGREALELLEQQSIDIVLSDQRMPEMTGSELMSQVAERWPNTIRMIITGYADSQAVIDAMNTGRLFRYLTKPCDLDELVDCLRAAATLHTLQQSHQQWLHDLAAHLATCDTRIQQWQQHLLPTLVDAATFAQELQQFQQEVQSFRARFEENSRLAKTSMPWQTAIH